MRIPGRVFKTGGGDANNVIYDNSHSDLVATNVQAAIDELAGDPETFTNSATNMVVRGMALGDKIRGIKLMVNTAFTAGTTATLGFPADHDELIAAAQVSLQETGIYTYVYNRTSTVAETLTMYFSGADSSGQIEMYIL